MMLRFSLHLFLLLPQFFLMFSISSAVDKNILLNCGASSSKSNSSDGREWDADSAYILKTSKTISTQLSELILSVERVPYLTARIFPSKFTYTIPVSKAGQKFLRLYFYPANYSRGFDMTKSFFSVHAADFTLLSNFSAFLNLENKSFTLVKEYVIVVNKSRLEVTFIPNPNSYAFVNGIEVVSIPDKFYTGGDGNRNLIKMVGQDTRFPLDDSVALETLYRLNVGGPDISSTGDTGMFRSWDNDQPYLLGNAGMFHSCYNSTPYVLGGHPGLIVPLITIPINYTSTTPRYTAPEYVYSTARTIYFESYGSKMTWTFEVDSGTFIFLLRLYFCEYRKQVTTSNQLVFNIIIHNQTAEQAADIFKMTGGRGVPVYKDYIVLVGDKPDSMSKTDLWLTLQPNKERKPKYKNTILNGLEIFRLSRSGSLATLNREFVPSPPPEIKKSRGNQKNGASHSPRLIVGACIGGSLGGMILFLLIVGFLLYRRTRVKSHDINKKSRSTTMKISLLPSIGSWKFSLEEINFATSNFDDNFVIGTGGFGNVYKGYMKNCTYPVAIKRLNPSSRQGAHEFQTEITILSNLLHRHLVPLIGCCDDSGEMILVYDYMVHGTLRGHLYGGNSPPLSWKQKLRICIGAARGLHYLHAGAERVIIHRDVKSTNILLDEKLVAKVSDFGLSKMGTGDTSVTHMSTVVKGSFGYLDPEYYLRRQLTTKSDVYSFGVVLFEVLCARPVIMQGLPYEQINLAEWSRNCYRNGNLGEIADINLTGEIAVESLNKFGDVAYSCLREHGTDRPTMSEVVSSLESALQLQESHEKSNHGNLFLTRSVAQTRIGEASTSSTSSEGFKSGIGSVFSDILNPNAR